MMIWRRPFNTYLPAAIAMLMVCGCLSPEYLRKKQVSTLRIHLEVNPDGTEHNQAILVYREHPASVNVEKTPFLTEADIAEAKVVDEFGGYSLLIKFDRRGTWLLEQYSSA